MTLFEAISATIRRLHYSPRTEEASLHWVREFIRFYLAVRRRTSASTQNQALCALVFLYRKVLEIEMPALEVRTIEALLGHKDVRTTMIYTHIVDRGPLGVVSPLDR